MAVHTKSISVRMIAFLFLFGTATAADTMVAYTKDTLWSGTAEITGRTVVSEGATLKIEPGTVINIRGGWDAKLIVQGRLHAVGTKEKPIRFDVETDNRYWSGITFFGDKATGNVERCVFKNGRGVTITCDGASPVIRHNTFLFRTYKGGGVLCQDGSRACIEENEFILDGLPFGGGIAGVLVVNAAPRVLANTFRGFAVGVQVSDRTRAHKKNAEGRTVSAKVSPVPADVRPTCKGNTCDGGIELFDERVAGGKQWKKIFTSNVVGMQGLRRLEVQPAKRGDTLILTTWHGSSKRSTIIISWTAPATLAIFLFVPQLTPARTGTWASS